MKIAIMQPYLFPYLGYFQLINAVDTFVVHDDVQYIKGGWMNRNRILHNGKDYLITFPVRKDDVFKNINQRFYFDENRKESKAIMRCVKNAYQKAPFFNHIFELLISIFSFESLNVSDFNVNQLKTICDYLSIKTTIILSSSLNKSNELKSEERVLNINKSLNSNYYLNPTGGVELYNKDRFEKHGIKLNFLKPVLKSYIQFNNDFISGLSIVDVIMFNSPETVNKMLCDYELL